MNNIPYLLALHSVDGLGPIRLKAILDYFKDPKLAWEADKNKLSEIGITNSVINLLIEKRKSLNPLKYTEGIQKSGIKCMTIFDENYPISLKQIYAPPIVLFYKGQIIAEDEKSIAIVGTRKMTNYGLIATNRFTKDLTRAGFTIVSGLARGVDSEAHKTALSEGGRTIAVLGGGLNNIFPPENKTLAEKIMDGFGAVVSEFPPDAPSLPGNFPARNRIIAGLSKAVLVTEAASDSGSLITARLAIEQGREVFAVPGPITSSLSKGPAELIRDGARIVFESKDIFDELGVSTGSTPSVPMDGLSNDEKKILEILENETLHIDEISRTLDFTAAKTSAILLKMEIVGLVRSMGSGSYCKS